MSNLPISANLQVMAISLQWKFQIIHPVDVSLDSSYTEHLEGIKEKVLKAANTPSDKDGVKMMRILEKILKNHNSVRISERKEIHIEYEECVVKEFEFEPYYVVASDKKMFDDEVHYQGSCKTTINKRSLTGEDRKTFYISNLTGTFIKEIPPAKGQYYISRHPFSMLPKFRDPETRIERGGSSTEQRPNVSGIRAILPGITSKNEKRPDVPNTKN